MASEILGGNQEVIRRWVSIDPNCLQKVFEISISCERFEFVKSLFPGNEYDVCVEKALNECFLEYGFQNDWNKLQYILRMFMMCNAVIDGIHYSIIEDCIDFVYSEFWYTVNVENCSEYSVDLQETLQMKNILYAFPEDKIDYD